MQAMLQMTKIDIAALEAGGERVVCLNYDAQPRIAGPKPRRGRWHASLRSTLGIGVDPLVDGPCLTDADGELLVPREAETSSLPKSAAMLSAALNRLMARRDGCSM